MEVVALSLSRFLRSEARFGLLCFLLWCLGLFRAFGGVPFSLDVHVALSFVGAGFTYLTLQYLHYFHVLRPKPRQSDFFLALVACYLSFVVVAVLAIGLGRSVSAVAFLLEPLFIALVLFSLDYFLSTLCIRSHVRRKVVVDLLPMEAIGFIKGLGALDCAAHIEFLSRAQLDEMVRTGREREIDLIIISRDSAEHFDADAVLVRAHLAGILVRDHHKALSDITGRIHLAQSDLWGYLLEAKPQTPALLAYIWLKKWLEPVLGVIFLALFAPVMVCVALLIKLTSPGPILYRQVRVGYLGKPFTLIKFRSMCVQSEPEGAKWCGRNDPRITPIGKILRKTRLDELPQLWNVVRSEMSFCGPRPERPEICQRFRKSIPLFPMRTIVRPGITGWAQVCAGYAASTEESYRKLEYDLFYIQHRSPRIDLIIIIKTVLIAFEGALRSQEARSDDLSSTIDPELLLSAKGV